ncbi:MAG: dTMP kinase [Betaproteobacteria bacterium]|nr:dTMP kinase [Betaproteobacteria bacterium]
MTGKFITFEGLDGAGKSTFVPYVRERLETAGRTVLVTREPGGTPAGERIRALLLDPASELTPETEALLVFAARHQHLQTVVWPALEKGTYVLCDRFTDSTFAYQGGGRGIPAASLGILESWVQGDFQPDLTLWFDVDEGVSHARLRNDRVLDRFELENGEFYSHVRGGYQARAAADPARIRRVDAAKTPKEVEVILDEYLLDI